MRKIVLGPAVVEAMRVAYEAGESKAVVAAIGGLSPSCLYRRIGEWGWTLRRRRPGTAPMPKLARPVRPPDFVRPPEGTPLRVRMERLVAHRIEVLEIEAGSGRAVDPDANARAIAANARTLALLRRLPPEPKEETASDDEPPRSLAALRDELRRHLERIAEEERAGSLPGGADADGVGEAPGPLADHLPAGPAPA